MYAKIIGYHAKDCTKCDNFLKGEFVVSEDSFWLGNGMYFWDNLSNAEYWNNEKVKKREVASLEKCKIVRAEISCEDFFDFTDRNIQNRFQELWDKIKNRDSVKRKNIKGFGDKIDCVFSFYPFLNDCSVIKAIADYSIAFKTKKKRMNHPVFENANFVSTIKTIYSVRKGNAIFDREEIIRNG